MNWTCGITTVQGRPYFAKAMSSIAEAGFPTPQVFVDNGLGVFGRWAIALWELLIRNPVAHRYAVFQDDVVLCKNVRQYLELWHPVKGYLNLFTYGASERAITGKRGWVEGALLKDGVEASADANCTLQKGQGALALVFDREAVIALLSEPSFVRKPTTTVPSTKLDGAIVTSMNLAGYREYVHSPSLCQHIGEMSTCQPGKRWNTHAMSFPGEEFDCMSCAVSR